mmetsp:Transcript_34949/g.99801  ORF Transcript_34949/g.99801 Transcript_34949/m.99801 type:complete len:132 (+) Transcript_34949:171-566(+)
MQYALLLMFAARRNLQILSDREPVGCLYRLLALHAGLQSRLGACAGLCGRARPPLLSSLSCLREAFALGAACVTDCVWVVAVGLVLACAASPVLLLEALRALRFEAGRGDCHWLHVLRVTVLWRSLVQLGD